MARRAFNLPLNRRRFPLDVIPKKSSALLITASCLRPPTSYDGQALVHDFNANMRRRITDTSVPGQARAEQYSWGEG
jgi:hypothetical protein